MDRREMFTAVGAVAAGLTALHGAQAAASAPKTGPTGMPADVLTVTCPRAGKAVDAYATVKGTIAMGDDTLPLPVSLPTPSQVRIIGQLFYQDGSTSEMFLGTLDANDTHGKWSMPLAAAPGAGPAILRVTTRTHRSVPTSVEMSLWIN